MTEVQIFASSLADQVESNAHDANDAEKEERRILLERVTACLVCIAASVTASRIWICNARRGASILTEVDGSTICVSVSGACAAGVPCSITGSIGAARAPSSVAGSTIAARVAGTAVPSSGSIVLGQRNLCRGTVAISVHFNCVVVVEFTQINVSVCPT